MAKSLVDLLQLNLTGDFVSKNVPVDAREGDTYKRRSAFGGM